MALFYFSGLIAFIVGVGAALIQVRSLINIHVSTGIDLFNATVIFSETNYHLSGGLQAYLQYRVQVYNSLRGTQGVTTAEKFMTNLSYQKNYTTYLNDTLKKEINSTTKYGNQAKTLYANSDNLQDINFSNSGFKKAADVFLNETSKKQSPTNPVTSLNVVQVLDMYRIQLQDLAMLDARVFTVFSQNKANFIAIKGFDVVLTKINEMIETCVQSLQTETLNHNTNFRNNLIYTSIVVAVVFLAWLGLMYYHRRVCPTSSAVSQF